MPDRSLLHSSYPTTMVWATAGVDQIAYPVFTQGIDYIVFRNGTAQAGDSFDAGDATNGYGAVLHDVIRIESNVTIDLRPVSFANFEQLEFQIGGSIAVNASQLVNGVAGRLINFFDPFSVQQLDIYVDSAAVDMRYLDFRFWNTDDIVNIHGGTGDERITGTRLHDTIWGGDGNDRLWGGGGYSVLYGEAGNDFLVSQTNVMSSTMGFNQLYGGTGNDTYLIRDNPDVVHENVGEGIDRVISESSHELAENVERLSLSTAIASGNYDIDGTGNALGNIIIGNQGENRLFGRAGDDVLRGGGGQDFLSGGAGRDLFAYGPGESGPDLAAADRITDFSFSDHDRIDLRAIGVTSIIGGAAFNGTAGQLRFVLLDSGQALVEFDADGDAASDLSILVNATGQALHPKDFII